MIKHYLWFIISAFVIIAGSSNASEDFEKELSLMANRVLQGQSLPEETKARLEKAWLSYWDGLQLKYNAPKDAKNADLPDLPPDVCVDNYVISIKMAVIYPEDHGGWTTKHWSIWEPDKSIIPIKKRLESQDDISLMVAAIMPAIHNNQVQYAIDTYHKLKTRDADWAFYMLATIKQTYWNWKPANTFLYAVTNHKGPLGPL